MSFKGILLGILTLPLFCILLPIIAILWVITVGKKIDEKLNGMEAIQN